MTKRQKEVLDFVKSYERRNGYAASLEDIKKHLKLSSVSTAHYHVKRLEESGYLKKKRSRARSISVAESYPMASIPLLEIITVLKSKTHHASETHALRIVDCSKIEEDIDASDVVLVRHQAVSENSPKAAALMDKLRVTLKKGEIRLQPESKTIVPTILKKSRYLKPKQNVSDIVKDTILDDANTESQKLTQLDYLRPKIKKIPTNSILHDDAINTLKKFPDKSIDLVIADPPYNLSKGSNIHFQNSGLKGFGGKWDKAMENWDSFPLMEYMNFTYEWLKEIRRVLKSSGSIWVFGTYHNIGLVNTVFQILDIEIINEVVWYKRNAFPNLAGRRLTASHETLLWAHVGNGKKRNYYFNYQASKDFSERSDNLKEKGKQMRTVWDIPNNKSKEEFEFGKHPTQKPLRVCRRIVSISSKLDDIVLAPFAGAGSECVAAKELGRRYIGIESDKKYVDIAKKRLQTKNHVKALFK